MQSNPYPNDPNYMPPIQENRREFLLINLHNRCTRMSRGFHMGLRPINMEFLLRSMFRIQLR